MAKKDNKTAEALLLDYKQVCAMLNISHQHFYALLDSGRMPLPRIRLGKSVRYDKRHVLSFIDSGCSVNWRPRR